MKKFLTVLFALMLVFGMAGVVRATSMYYTFQGSIYSILGPTGATGYTTYITDRGFSIGTPVTYIFEIDSDKDGSYERNNTTVYTFVDTSTNNYFYTDLLSPPPLPDTGVHALDTQIKEYHYGVNQNIYGASQENLVQIYHGTSPITNVLGWSENIALKAANFLYVTDVKDADADANLTEIVYSRMYADVILTDISVTNPLQAVPEPTTLLLLGIGLIGLAGLSRKRFFK